MQLPCVVIRVDVGGIYLDDSMVLLFTGWRIGRDDGINIFGGLKEKSERNIENWLEELKDVLERKTGGVSVVFYPVDEVGGEKLKGLMSIVELKGSVFPELPFM